MGDVNDVDGGGAPVKREGLVQRHQSKGGSSKEAKGAEASRPAREEGGGAERGYADLFRELEGIEARRRGETGGEEAVRRKAARKPKPRRRDPPHWVCEIMQWLHVMLILKFLFYLYLDGWKTSALALAFCFVGGQYGLDRFKNEDRQPIGTLTNTYFIFRTAAATAGALLGIARGLNMEPASIYPPFLIALPLVSFFCISFAQTSSLWYYSAIMSWELLGLPLLSYLRINLDDVAFHVRISDYHLVWALGVILAISLQPIDPYTLRWRESDLKFDRRLRVPWDPPFY